MANSIQEEPVTKQQSNPEITSAVGDQTDSTDSVSRPTRPTRKGKETTRDPQLRYCEPYYHPYRTSVKQRWIGRQILERHALASGVTKVNGKVVGPEYVLKNGDRIELTSGLMILALTGKASTGLAEEFIKGHVKKEYLARVNGKFPEEEIVVDQSLLTIDRQMGVVICTPDGKDAKTIFKRLHYDAKRDQSVVHCKPITGRTHQIRVHLQYIGHPIVNDPLYGTSDIWGPNLGKGGVDLTPDITDENEGLTGGPDTPSTIASVEARMQGKEALPSAKLQQKFNWKLEKELMKLRANGGKQSPGEGEANSGTGTPQKELLPREMEDDTVVGGSPIYLSREAREIVAKLRRQKDEQEDWAKWSEVVYKMKEAAKLQSEGISASL
ncbi:hypothetical protein QFC22_002619 [Naganishia vaughanmartiniae]|uniref:Uncharacterized protein n=1 Tax=Naganishia vaughanmartiniae TaxID=1424756 RepID=A0ACC2XA52_9TREE|nr:hypothetical protein QFC22_002619 [Naganishia vaughanmartiniae]